MRARISTARFFSIYYPSEVLDTPRVIIKDSSGTTLTTILMSASTSVANLFISDSSYTFTSTGTHKLHFEHKVATVYTLVRIDDIVVGTDPNSDIALSTTVAQSFRIDDAEIGNQTSTVNVELRDSSDTLIENISAPWTVGVSSYQATVTTPISSEGVYYLLWFDDTVITKVEELLAVTPKEQELIEFLVGDNSTGSTVAHTSTDVLISSTAAVPIVQDITDANGMVSFSVPPATYVVTLRKSGVTFTKNNQEFTVVNTKLSVGNNSFAFMTKRFDANFSTYTSPLSVSTLTGTFHNFQGIPLRYAEIHVELQQGPGNYSGIGAFGTTFTTKTDVNGYVEFTVLQGVVITVTVMTHSWSRTFTVPSNVGPNNILTLAASAPDVFDIVTVSIPDAPIRS